MTMQRNAVPTEVVSVGDIVDVYVYEIDEERGRVSLSFLPLEKLQEKQAAYKYRKNKNNKNNKKHNEKPKKKEVTMDDAMARLMERFSK